MREMLLNFVTLGFFNKRLRLNSVLLRLVLCHFVARYEMMYGFAGRNEYGFSNLGAVAAAAPSGWPYATAAAYAATPRADTAYTHVGQIAAAVATVQQQHQLQEALGVVSASSGYGAHFAATSLTDPYNTVGTMRFTGGICTSLSGYTNSLPTTASAALAAANPTGNSSFVSVGGTGTISSNPLPNTASLVTGDSPAGRTFPKKHCGGQSDLTSDIQQFYCEACKISCMGRQAGSFCFYFAFTYTDHVEGKKHEKKEALQKVEDRSLSKSWVSFRCEMCNVTCTGKVTLIFSVEGISKKLFGMENGERSG
ncbi:unnamed protein product [Toxocara canis]|uniref:Nuclear receptor domain-containing protein n=1 Tax=Toxocara canis TaxID=6265 RepID=A0A183VCU6_TOXCA|nr:unnamed protein product [Toxocara canis]